MDTGFAIALRVGVFAGIIISILYAALQKSDRENQARYITWGVIASITFSLLVQLWLQRSGPTLTETRIEEIIEGVLMTLLAGGLGVLLIWLQLRQGQSPALLDSPDKHNELLNIRWGAFCLAFLAIAREGFEVFRAILIVDPALSYRETVLGVGLAILTAIMIGWMLYHSLVGLTFRKFVSVTSYLLILIGAGLLANAVHELNHAEVLPTLIDHVWDTGFAVKDSSIVGGLLSSILGYNQDPSLSEVLAYLGYLVGAGIAFGGLRLSRPNHMKRA